MLHHPSSNGGRTAWASSDDYIAISLVIIFIGLGFGAYQAWINYHAEISWAVFRLQRWKMELIAHFTDRYAQQDASVTAAHPEKATFWQLLALLDNVGRFFRIPAGATMLLLAAACYRWAAPARFCRQFDLVGLRREQARFFRSASAALGRRLKLTSVAKGEPHPADPALRPDEWVERYAQHRDGSLDETAAKRALVRQLGPKWQGLDKAAPHVRCLFAAFALHLTGRRETAFALLGGMAEAVAPMRKEAETGPARPLSLPAVLVRSADRVLRDPDVRRPALMIAARHAYTTTALMSVLNEARRRSGVLPPAAFSGLKLVDRPLWYALHSLGFAGDGPGQKIHPNPRVEAAGARDHWAAEKAVGHKLPVPSVDQALASIRTAWNQHSRGRSGQSG